MSSIVERKAALLASFHERYHVATCAYLDSLSTLSAKVFENEMIRIARAISHLCRTENRADVASIFNHQEIPF